METLKSQRWSIARRMLTGLAGSAFMLVSPALLDAAPRSQPPSLPVPVAAPQDAPRDAALLPKTCPDGGDHYLTLAEARQMALARQPAVAAAHSSLAAAQARYRAISQLRGFAILARDYQIRKDQSCLGVQVAEAGVAQAEADAVYAATRLYLAVLYARAQIALAGDVDEQLKKLQNASELKPKIFQDLHKLKIQGYLDILVERREEAVQGEKRALAALREALGATEDCHLQVPLAPLPDLQVLLKCDEVIGMAVARRGELAAVGGEEAVVEHHADALVLEGHPRSRAASTMVRKAGWAPRRSVVQSLNRARAMVRALPPNHRWRCRKSESDCRSRIVRALPSRIASQTTPA